MAQQIDNGNSLIDINTNNLNISQLDLLTQRDVDPVTEYYDEINVVSFNTPTVYHFYQAIPYEILISISLTSILFLSIFIVFLIQIRAILNRTPKQYLARTLTLNAIYPVVGAAGVICMLIPRATLLCDTVCHLGFTYCAYQYFCLILEYVGGESNFVKAAADSKVFKLQTPPCCCCCCCLKSFMVTKNRFTYLRIMILQMSIIQSILMISLNIIRADNPVVFQDIQLYFAPFIVASILPGVWGLQMFSRMIAPLFPEYKVMGKYFAMQLVLIVARLQPVIASNIAPNVNIQYSYPITAQVVANSIVQPIVLIQIFIISIWAHYLYRVPFDRK